MEMSIILGNGLGNSVYKATHFGFETQMSQKSKAGVSETPKTTFFRHQLSFVKKVKCTALPIYDLAQDFELKISSRITKSYKEMYDPIDLF